MPHSATTVSGYPWRISRFRCHLEPAFSLEKSLQLDGTSAGFGAFKSTSPMSALGVGNCQPSARQRSFGQARQSRCRARPLTSDEPLALVIEVRDLGPGIQAELLPRLFSRGARGTDRLSGLGLGLYIVRQVMALHGGTVELVSSGDGGTTFRLSINQTVSDD